MGSLMATTVVVVVEIMVVEAMRNRVNDFMVVCLLSVVRGVEFVREVSLLLEWWRCVVYQLGKIMSERAG